MLIWMKMLNSINLNLNVLNMCIVWHLWLEQHSILKSSCYDVVLFIRFPPKLRVMCHCLFQVISLRFPHDSIFATGTVIFLRFFNPVLGKTTKYLSKSLLLVATESISDLMPLFGMSAVKVYFNILEWI